MRILAVSAHFPSCNAIGALRLGTLTGVLRAKCRRSTVVVANGFDPADFPTAPPPPPADVARGMPHDEQFSLLEPLLATAAARPGRRRKVVVVTRKLDVGGTERHLLQVLPHLDRSRFDVSVTVLRPGGKLEQRMRDAGVPVAAPPPRLSGWAALVWSAARLVLHMLIERRTIFHFFLPEAYAVGGLCGLLTRHRRLIMSRRSLNLYQAGHPLVTQLERFMHKRMAAVIGNSRAVLADLRAEGAPDQRLHLIYNGLHMAAFSHPRDRDAVRRGLGVGTDEIAITMVANLIPYKGHLDLVQAMAGIAEHLPPWRLLLIGRDDGVAAQIVEYCTSAGIAERVSLLGERDDVAEVLCASDMGVLCSHQEGFANSVLEGMAAGLPMVVTDVGGNAEAILDGVAGIVVPPKAPGPLGAAIRELACDAGCRARYGAAARERAQSLYSLPACLDSYQDIYDSVGGNGATP